MMNDADIEMAELAEQGDMMAKGICPICTDWLDPKAHGVDYDLGPVLHGFHVDCLKDQEAWS